MEYSKVGAILLSNSDSITSMRCDWDASFFIFSYHTSARRHLSTRYERGAPQGWKKKIGMEVYGISSRHQIMDLDVTTHGRKCERTMSFLTVIDCRPLVPCRFLAERVGTTRSGAKVGL